MMNNQPIASSETHKYSAYNLFGIINTFILPCYYYIINVFIILTINILINIFPLKSKAINIHILSDCIYCF